MTTSLQDLSYNTINLVVDSYDQLRLIENYQSVAGVVLMQRLFEKVPQTKKIFGFPLDTDPKSKDVIESNRFRIHSELLMGMFDVVLDMLGPDMFMLEEVLPELGEKHLRYGVKPEMFAALGDALIFTMNEMSKTNMSEETSTAWKEVYSVLTAHMMQPQSRRNSS
jgi:hypothetical protein